MHTLSKILTVGYGFRPAIKQAVGLKPCGGEEMSPGIAVAVVPEEYYRKPKGVQFKKSFQKREDAIGYAENHSCRVVIASGAGDRYDVLFDPGSTPRFNLRFELVVDRGEMVAVPRVTLPQSKLPVLPSASQSPSSQPSLKIAWNALHSRLFA